VSGPAELPPLACGGCTRCCRGDTILLYPEEDPSRWDTVRDDWTGDHQLRRGLDGNCVYLGPQGCTIHGRQPRMCQEYDCRLHALNVQAMPASERVKRLGNPGLAEGARRLRTLGL
jgi:hypothetical protein